MALVRGRFKLDPKGPEPARPVPAPRSAVSSPSPAPAPHLRPPPASHLPAPSQTPARGNRKLILIGAVVVALLLVGGAVAVFVATALGFPDKYVLDRDEMPSGMSNARLTSSELDDAGMARNPGPIDWDQSDLADGFTRAGIDDPDEAHGQVLAAGASRIVIVAMKYAEEDQARDAAQRLRQICSFGSAAGLQAVVMRDGDVVVTVLSDDGASRAQVQSVATALREKASDLERACST